VLSIIIVYHFRHCSHPVASGDVTQYLTPFEIRYTIAQTDIPGFTDYDGVTALTSRYINDHFFSVYAADPGVEFSESQTGRTGENFELGQPVQVFYQTNVTFAGSSAEIPSVSDLDASLEAAFTSMGEKYLEELQGLEMNIFSTTSSYEFLFVSESEDAPPAADGAGSLDAGTTAGIAVAAGAGAFVVLITAVVLHRRRQEADDNDRLVKYVEEGDGHMTVAGETYAGTISVDSRSVKRRDEEYNSTGEADDAAADALWDAGETEYSHQFRTSLFSSPKTSDDGHDSDGSNGSSGASSNDSGSSTSTTPRQMAEVDL